MSNILKSLRFACIICDNAIQGGKIVSDGQGEAQLRSGLQRIFASNMTNNPGRKDCALKPEAIQQPFWQSQPVSYARWAETGFLHMERNGGGR